MKIDLRSDSCLRFVRPISILWACLAFSLILLNGHAEAVTLEECIREALQRNPDANAAAIRVEAARAIGLREGRVLSLIVIPQAMRVIIPPLISQYLNLTKNSSLALTIGYQEVFAVGKITINQAGRAVPVFLMVMATYLAMSLLTAGVLNLYNRRIQLVER